MDLEALLAQLANIESMDLDQLTELAGQLNELVPTLRAADPTDENLAALQSVLDALTKIGAAQEAITTDTSNRQAQQQSLADQIAALVGPEEGDDGDGGDDDGDGDGDGAGDGTGADDATTGEGASSTTAADEQQPIAAAAGAPSRTAAVATRVAARRPASVVPDANNANRGRSTDQRRLSLVSAGTWQTDRGSIELGQRLDLNDNQALADAFLSAVKLTRGYTGPRTRIPVVRSLGWDAEQWAEAGRWLGLDPILNARTLRAAIDRPGSMTAAGGICAPQQASYDILTIGDDARPVRDTAMARFGADRGGIRTLPVPLIGDLDAAITIWDHDTDLNPGETVKECLVITCDEEDDPTLVEAIVRCIETGNFRARYFPEQIRAWLDLAAVNQARVAENRLLASIGAGSTDVTTEKVLGTTRDTLTMLDRAMAGFESRHRAPGTRWRFIAARWLLRNMVTDITRQMPVGSTDETLAVAEGDVNRWFASKPNLMVTYHLDGESGQIFGAQGDGDLLGWPDDHVGYLYPEGSWLFLDGAQQDFGIVRDSVTNSTNQFQMMAETMEGAHFHGVESFRVTQDICADGSASALVDIDPCTTGS